MEFPCKMHLKFALHSAKTFEPKIDLLNVVDDVDNGVNVATSVDADLLVGSKI